MSTGRASHGRIKSVHGASSPPADELPAVVPTPNIIWRGDGIVVAVPSLQLYSIGAELTIMCRMTSPQPRTIEHARSSSDRLSQLRVNGIPVAQFGGNYDDFGFTFKAWIPIAAGTTALTFELDWPEVRHAQHQLPGIREAAAQVIRLWPEADRGS